MPWGNVSKTCHLTPNGKAYGPDSRVHWAVGIFRSLRFIWHVACDGITCWLMLF